MKGIEYVRAMKGGWIQARNAGMVVTANVLANCLNLHSPAPLLDSAKYPPIFGRNIAWGIKDRLERAKNPFIHPGMTPKEAKEAALRRLCEYCSSEWGFRLPHRIIRRKHSLRQDQ
jgi:hypothetical protein